MGRNQVIRKIIPVMTTLLVLGIFLSLYFFRYIPRQQYDHNRRAFLELEQIEKAIESRNTAYTRAITFIPDEGQAHKRRYTSPLSLSFKEGYILRSSLPHPIPTQKGAMFFNTEGPDASYRMTYLLRSDSTVIDSTPTLSIRLDSVLKPIFSTYKDIFENYLLIGPSAGSSQNRILYNPGGLSLDTWINTDSLLKKDDGVSLRNVRDVIIEGNPYKLFIYPFQLGNQSVILAGLISSDQYTEGYKDIPLDLLIPAGIVILLLLMNFPILKVFILGFYERITDMDIRLVIGSYFIAAFTGFFLFSWIYLSRVQNTGNKKQLEVLSQQVEDRFTSEIKTIIRQLNSWDTTYAGELHRNVPLLPGVRGWGRDIELTKDSTAPDSAYRPLVYPYSDYAFWIDSNGKWLATFSEKKYNNRPILLQVSDRKYFKDFINKRYLELPDTPSTPFTIQPTLSRLDGEYTITIIIQSHAWRDTTQPSNTSRAANHRLDTTLPHPLQLVGLSAELLSVTNPILPPGYSFSIIDDNGQVLYDAKQGRALLSNILKESDDPGPIQECVRFRNQRYFPLFRLKGQKVALTATPMKALPYTLLTYYDLSNADSSQLHLIGLSAFFAALVLGLLLFSTLINELTGKRPRMLQAPANHFEWLRPLPAKEDYYKQLIRGMLSMFAVYIIAWLIIKFLPRQFEFSLFFISLTTPFYIALYYYSLREKHKLAMHHSRNPMATPSDNPATPDNAPPFKWSSLARSMRPVLFFLLLIIVVIISFSATDIHSTPAVPWVSLLLQLILALVSGWFIYDYNPSPPVPPAFYAPLHYTSDRKISAWLRYYSLAIVIGVVLISIIPACGIFWLLSGQEASLQHNSSRVEMARTINARRLILNERMKDYKSALADPGSTPDKPSLRQIKFKHGIYLLHGDSIVTIQPGETAAQPGGNIPATNDNIPATGANTSPPRRPFFPVSTQYQDVHQLFFPDDSNILSSSIHPNSAEDSSWLFFSNHTDQRHSIILQYNAPQDWVDRIPLQLRAGPDADAPALSVIGQQTGSTGTLFIVLYFGAQLLGVFLAYKVTMSLAIRIFMIGIFRDTPCPPTATETAGIPAETAETETTEPPGEPTKPAASRLLADHSAPTKPVDTGEPLPDWLTAIREAEKNSDNQELILCNRHLHEKLYAQLWTPLQPIEKFVLFDLAKDGFSNYRTAAILYQLRKKNLLVFVNGQLEPVTCSFREYVLDRSIDKDVQDGLKKSRQNGTWQAFKLPLTILFTAFGLFIFFTQGALYQKLGGLFTSILSMGAQISSFFDKTGGRQPAPDPNSEQSS